MATPKNYYELLGVYLESTEKEVSWIIAKIRVATPKIVCNLKESRPS